jgi:hypothetical protein
MGYVTREDARNVAAGTAECMLMMREQTGKFERPVYSRPEQVVAVPPAGGEVEVLLQVRAVGNRVPSEWADVRDSTELEQMQRTNAICEARDTQNLYEFRELVDRAHVTRLQAEVSALQQRLTIADQRVDDLLAEIAALRQGPCKMIAGDELP